MTTGRKVRQDMIRFKKHRRKTPATSWQKAFLTSSLLVFGLFFSALVAPAQALADTAGSAFGGNFAGIITSIEWLVRMVLLPVGIILASGKLIYIAIVGGMFGVDPLHLIVDGDKEINSHDVTMALRDQLWGFAKGLAWVAGLFIIFEVALNIAAFFADQVEKLFGK